MMEATLERPGTAADPDELRKEAGEPVGEMPAKTPADPLPPEVDKIVVDGTAQLDIFSLGGKLPTRATIALTGGSVGIVAGQAFEKGDRIRFSGEAIVNDVGQKDIEDGKTGIVVDCVQRHKARVVDLVVDSAS
jgi:hypothetical protein